MPKDENHKLISAAAVKFNCNSRIIDEPSLEKLKKASPTPHVTTNIVYNGYIIETDEGRWLQFVDLKFSNFAYVWLGKTSYIVLKGKTIKEVVDTYASAKKTKLFD